MSKTLIGTVGLSSVALSACSNTSLGSSASDLSTALEQTPSAAPSIDVQTGNHEVDGLIDQTNQLISDAWTWAVTSVQGLIDQIPIINQLI